MFSFHSSLGYPRQSGFKIRYFFIGPIDRTFVSVSDVHLRQPAGTLLLYG